MAIDLFCYSALPINNVNELIENATKEYGDLFLSKFCIYGLDELSPNHYYDSVSIENAAEHGFNATCLFLVRLRDKSAADLIDEVARALKNEFGSDNILILFENEGRR